MRHACWKTCYGKRRRPEFYYSLNQPNSIKEKVNEVPNFHFTVDHGVSFLVTPAPTFLKLYKKTQNKSKVTVFFIFSYTATKDNNTRPESCKSFPLVTVI